ncbi:hypothetical protein X566_12320 [Afipia sp. P52-10]|jgi:hypothetical protein|uniref:hypothetical protein n=1 Tax=Afipia sp. P52-10 TaxID=1429916 RepID=UPI0003DF3119|nr:hypothetical protein [Afipia sp. P52-10]ETR79101.1 hypothetical protein X566_12320 [Afipia sp. P52-10]
MPLALLLPQLEPLAILFVRFLVLSVESGWIRSTGCWAGMIPQMGTGVWTWIMREEGRTG